MSSSASDMLRFVRALLQGGANEQGRILKPETLRQMMIPQYAVDPRLPAMGLGFIIWPLGGRHVAGHGGGLPGFVTHLVVAPDAAAGVVVLANASTAPHIVERVAFDLMRRILSEHDPALQLPRLGVLEQPFLWPELQGTYGPAPGPLTNFRTWVTWGGAVRVVVQEGHLALRSRLPVGPRRHGLRLYPLDAADPLLFGVSLHGTMHRVVFQRDAGGRVRTLTIWGSGMAFPLRKLPSLRRRLAQRSAVALRAVVRSSGL